VDKKSLGFDPNILPVLDSNGQFIITISARRRQANPQEVSNHSDLIFIRRRTTSGLRYRVFKAVEIDGNGVPNGPPVVLKDIWIDSDCTREGNILALLHAAAADDHFLTTICHGDVWTKFGILDDTANALMRGLNVKKYHK
jgi:hypothetical protein